MTGWGRVTHDGKLSDILQKVQIPIALKDKCRQVYATEKLSSQII